MIISKDWPNLLNYIKNLSLNNINQLLSHHNHLIIIEI